MTPMRLNITFRSAKVVPCSNADRFKSFLEMGRADRIPFDTHRTLQINIALGSMVLLMIPGLVMTLFKVYNIEPRELVTNTIVISASVWIVVLSRVLWWWKLLRCLNDRILFLLANSDKEYSNEILLEMTVPIRGRTWQGFIPGMDSD